ncbi:MAG: uroporphyrinogen-III C-methyltransferase [Chromatiales bacterium]|nr:uroporphyrinogen-III C-methyltransferase [Chromatiales bacterium]
MDYFPLFARLVDEPCLVVGGGQVALRKTRMLCSCGAQVTVNAPEICAGLRELAAGGQVSLVERPFDPQLVETHLLVVAATGDSAVNATIAATARAAHRLCNVVDDGPLSSFINPAVIDRSPVIVALSSGGAAPVLVRRLRQQLEQWLPARLGVLARWAGSLRDQVRSALPGIDARRRFWEQLLEGPLAQRLLSGQAVDVQQDVEMLLGEAESAALPGEAWLVGAGPGDPGLLTLAGLRLLEQAEVILHDRLVSPEILALARRDAEFIDVGKTGGGPSTSQEAINRLLVERVRAGQRVCRLKGGDPYIFGRGGEEALALAAAGLPFRVIPGITAASGCAAYAGMPLTHRELASAVSFVSARLAPGAGDPDWAALAALDHTLAIYMPVARLADVAAALVRHGRPPGTPAALVEAGTTRAQRHVSATLEDIAGVATREQVGSPALLLVGPVVALAGQLGWWAPGQAKAPAPRKVA